jgi:flagellar biosynthesis/type III secretory pathway protein FliH
VGNDSDLWNADDVTVSEPDPRGAREFHEPPTNPRAEAQRLADLETLRFAELEAARADGRRLGREEGRIEGREEGKVAGYRAGEKDANDKAFARYTAALRRALTAYRIEYVFHDGLIAKLWRELS